MLEKLLAELRSGGTFEVTTLAKQLETTPILLSAMLNHLQEFGYIASYHTCGDACSTCYLLSECRPSKGDHPNFKGNSLYVLVQPISDK